MQNEKARISVQGKNELVSRYLNDYSSFSFFCCLHYNYRARYLFSILLVDLKTRRMIYIPIIYLRSWYTACHEREKSEEGNLTRHKTRNSETENISRRTTVIMRHKVFVSQFFCRLDNSSPGFTLKLVAADYDIKYFSSIWSRWYVFSREIISSVDRFSRQ